MAQMKDLPGLHWGNIGIMENKMKTTGMSQLACCSLHGVMQLCKQSL